MVPGLPPRTRGPVEDLVREAFGGGTRIVSVEDVGGRRRRSLIHRLTLSGPNAPQSVIVKQLKAVRPDSARDNDQTSLFLAELSSLRFLTELGLDDLSPRLFAHDVARHILVMQDLGPGVSMADVLQARSEPSSVPTLHAYAKSLGRMRPFGTPSQPVPDPAHRGRGAGGRRALGEGRPGGHLGGRHLSRVGGPVPVAGSLSRAERRAGTPDRAGRLGDVHHGDPCPDNNVVAADGSVVHFDFEFARARPALVDGSYFVVPFPTCWCVKAIPSALRIEITETYRAELATHLPAANDPVVFGRALTDAAALWVARDMTAGLLAGALKKDQKWGISTWRQRMIHRLPDFIELAHRHDHLPAFAETAESLHRRLTGQWVKLTPMPTYPALR